MLREAKYPYILINDSDIRVSPNYLTRVMARFGAADGCEDPQGGHGDSAVSWWTAADARR